MDGLTPPPPPGGTTEQKVNYTLASKGYTVTYSDATEWDGVTLPEVWLDFSSPLRRFEVFCDDVDFFSTTEIVNGIYNLDDVESSTISVTVGTELTDLARQRLANRYGVASNAACDRIAYAVLAFMQGLVELEIAPDTTLTYTQRRQP